MRKAFVLLSGGMDSTTCLYKALQDYAPPEGRWDDKQEHVEAVSIDYGQRHAKEVGHAIKITHKLNMRHTLLNVRGLLSDSNTMLTNPDIDLPSADYADLPAGVSPTYVPNRNMVMLSVLTAHAQKWINAQNKELEGDRGYKLAGSPSPQAGIYFGAHAEDAHNWAYPDCTPEFIGAMANAIFIASYQQIRLHTPLMSMSKAEVVQLGDKLGVPWEQTWSCYAGGGKHCGTCPTCRARKSAFFKSGLVDPTTYDYV